MTDTARQTNETPRDETIIGLDHMQVAIPRSGEAQAKTFYADILGLEEIAKPTALSARGGSWYRCGAAQLHLGLVDDARFHPQEKSHPALLARDVAQLERLRERLVTAQAPIIEAIPIPGYQRFETRDPFGNRLELLCHLTPTVPAPPPDASQPQTIKDRVRAMFGKTAQAYVTSSAHAQGDDLERIVALAAPHAAMRALDISTGGGHTALALAPHVAHMVASDLTPGMLAAARAFITARGLTNVDFVVADAEALPFLDATFDLVSVRIAPHHYADIQRAAYEMARVLVPGGRLVVVDNIAPADPALDALVNAWDKQRDPSHVREYTAEEWHGFLAHAGLVITDSETSRKPHDFAAWAERSQMPAAERAQLEAAILAAPAFARNYFEVIERDGRLVSWSADYVLLGADKPA